MNAHQTHRVSDAPGASTGAVPTPPTSQAWQSSKRCREAGDACSWDTGQPSAKRSARFPDTRGDHEALSAAEAFDEVDRGLHSIEGLPLVDDISEIYGGPELDQLFTTLDGPQTHAYPQMSIDDLLDDALFLDDLDGFTSQEPRRGTPLDAQVQQPPSSVLRALDCASRSADEFDRNLQYSSPRTSSTLCAVGEREPPLLPQEEDWEGVGRNAQHLTNDATPTEPDEPRASTIMPTPAASASTHGGDMTFKAFKTFFHLNEMLDAKVQMFKHQPEMVFDLFARVLYSSRENFVKKQYFQFRDLFKETPPYLSGALLG